MITIHSSSLAYRPAGYINTGQEAVNKNSANGVSNAKTNESIDSRNIQPASTPEQVKIAMDKLVINDAESYTQNGNPRNLKALQVYNKTRNQLVQTELESIVSHVDYYA